MTGSSSERSERVGVVGAGQMGGGIAQVSAAAGYQVTLVDASLERAERGREQILGRLQRLVERNKLTEAERSQCEQRLSCATLERAAPTVDIWIEAATEEMQLKQRLFEQLDRLSPAPALLFSNTSSISITQLAACTGRPERVAGLHFMNPVPVMRLVELVVGLQTSEPTRERGRELAQALGKTVVVSRDKPGFIVNRILIPMLNEACFALDEGVATVEAIDQAIVLGLNHPMGPLRLADLIGLDTVLAIAQVLHRDFGDSKYRPNALLSRMVAAGHHGVKTGRGFYIYENGKPAAVSRL